MSLMTITKGELVTYFIVLALCGLVIISRNY